MTLTVAIDRPRPSARRASILRSDAEALAAAWALAASWSRTAATIDAERRVPHEELRPLSHSGLLAITVPKAHGGPELSTGTLINVFRILAATDLALAQVPQNHFDFVDTLIQAEPA